MAEVDGFLPSRPANIRIGKATAETFGNFEDGDQFHVENQAVSEKEITLNFGQENSGNHYTRNITVNSSHISRSDNLDEGRPRTRTLPLISSTNEEVSQDELTQSQPAIILQDRKAATIAKAESIGRTEHKLGHRRVDNTGVVTYKKKPTSELMGAIQLGIIHSVSRLSNKPNRDVLMQDFQNVEKVDFPQHGSAGVPTNQNDSNRDFVDSVVHATPAHGYSDFRFKTYAPTAYRHFRRLFKIEPEDFLNSCGTEALIELSNPGASGSIFYKTADDEFIIKTVQKREAAFLKPLLAGYYMNIVQNTDTLLPKFYGHYCYKCGGRNIRFIIMNNLLPSTVHIHEKYDLKGSTHGRKASVDELSKRSPTLKDLDFKEKHPHSIILPNDAKNKLFEALQKDVLVLESFKIMDYSLLLGVHNVDISHGDLVDGEPNGHANVIPGNNFNSNDESAVTFNPSGPAGGASGGAGGSGGGAAPPASPARTRIPGQRESSDGLVTAGGVTFGSQDEEEASSPGEERASRIRPRQSVRHSVYPALNNPVSNGHPVANGAIYPTTGRIPQTGEDYDRHYDAEWKALGITGRPYVTNLPMAAVPARNIRGDRLLLFIGIIDILQHYELKKKAEHIFKSIVYNGNTVSVTDPRFYARRFLSFLTGEVFMGVDDAIARQEEWDREGKNKEITRIVPLHPHIGPLALAKTKSARSNTHCEVFPSTSKSPRDRVDKRQSRYDNVTTPL